MSVREKLNESKTAAGVAAGVLIVACFAFIYFYWNRGRVHFDPTTAYYSDDDGQSYFKDSVYKFPPFDHNGKTAFGAEVAESSNGHRFVAYLTRFTPEAQKRLQDRYDNAVKNNLSVQQQVLGLMGSPGITLGGMEEKLDGSGHKWVPHGQLANSDIKGPNGEVPQKYLDEPQP